MTIDPTTRRELLEARDAILGQLEEIEFRATAQGQASVRKGGTPDYRDVYARLQQELGDIDQMLGSDLNDVDG